MAGALAGRTIAVTRPLAQADALNAAIRAEGGTPFGLPLLEIEAVQDADGFARIAASLDDYALVFFVSANAVSHGLAGVRAHRLWPPGPVVATVGPGSAAVLLAAGFATVIAPPERFDSEGVLALPEFAAEALAGRRVLILRGDGGRELLADELSARGAQVTSFTCYTRNLPPPDVPALVARMTQGQLDALTLSSSEAVRHFAQVLRERGGEALFDLPVFAPHLRVADCARSSGFRRVILTEGADAGLLAGLCAHFGQAPRDEGLGYHSGMEETREIPPPAPALAPTSARRSWRGLGHPVVIAGAVLLALLAWQWIETRARLEVLQQQVAQRLGESDAATRELKGRAKEIQDSLQSQGNRIAVQEARIAESQGQQVALEALYQDLSRSRDEWVLAEVEQALNIAQQQLQLAGNVQAALIALQSAEARLAGFEGPQLLPLRKSIARDIERLKALPMADISAMGLALENLIERIDTLPLAFEHSPPKPEKPGTKTKSAKPASAAGQSTPVVADEPAWYTRLANDFWTELRGLIRIERLDRPDPALLSPSQTVFLRENLRLRLLSARLALLQRDGRIFREDCRLAASWMERYFDVTDRDLAMRLAELRKAQGAKLAVELPNLNETLAALHNARVAGAR